MGEKLMAKKMTTNSHNRGSGKSHSRKEKKYAKANGIRQQWTDEEYEKEEYEKEKAEIAVQLELLMELLQENVKDQRHGWNMRKKV